MAGKKGRSGGSNRIPVAVHIARGTYRASRHGPRPLATVLPMPAAVEPWTPTDTALGPAGRALLSRVMERYECSVTEGEILLEAARCADVLAALRAQALADIAAQRLEVSWSKHYTALLLGLRLEK